MIKKPHVFVCLTLEEGCRREYRIIMYEVRHDLILVESSLRFEAFKYDRVPDMSEKSRKCQGYPLKAKIVKKVSGNSGPF